MNGWPVSSDFDGSAQRRDVAIRPRSAPTALIVCAGAAALAVVSRSRGGDWSWLTVPSAVACIVALALFVIFYASSRKETMSAGTGWYASSNGFVRTDKLTELRVRVILSGTYVSLRDIEGRHIDLPLSELADDPNIWASILVGVEASVEAGLIVDDARTARTFGVAKKAFSGPLSPESRWPGDQRDARRRVSTRKDGASEQRATVIDGW